VYFGKDILHRVKEKHKFLYNKTVPIKIKDTVSLYGYGHISQLIQNSIFVNKILNQLLEA